LTETGFKKYNELSKKDIVYSMKNEKLVKNKINNIIIKKYNGKMIRLQNENTDELVTPNHRIYYKDYGRTQWHKDNNLYGWCKNWKVKEAKDIAKTYINLPNAKIYNGKIKPDIDRLKLSAWYITEGHLNKHDIVEISQSWNHNQNNCREILSILNSLKINYRRTDRIQKNKKYLYVYFKFSEIESVMKERYYNSYEMRLPHNFMEYNLNSKIILFKELLKGDGSIQNGKTTYVSYSNKLLNEFQILSTMIGLKCSVKRKHHVCYIKRNRTGNSILKTKSEIDYNGFIWCVSVDNENIVVKRNGKIFISGNSLYPSVMIKEYPNPNSLRHCYKNSLEKINKYHGISDITFDCPYMKYPLLPVRTKDKLLFCVGKNIRGFYTHIEIRKAIELGYKIKKVHETYYFKETIYPFVDYVNDLYAKRMEYKKQKSPMEDITKLMLNSLYGKFCQKFLDKENIVSSIIFDDTNKNIKSFEPYNDNNFVRVVEDREPSNFCMVMWGSMVTAYARLEIYKYLSEHNPTYCDTDSIITRHTIPTSEKLGDMKLEMEIKSGIIVKPKFYAIINKSSKPMFCKKCGCLMELFDENYNIFRCVACNITSNRNKIKIKGIGIKMQMPIFLQTVFSDEHKISYEKIAKFKESLRRKLCINEVIPITKVLNLRDNKRVWDKIINYSMLNDSEPMDITNSNIKPVMYNEDEDYHFADSPLIKINEV
jgi:hypothetical protein